MNGEVFDGLISFSFQRQRSGKRRISRTEFLGHWANWDLAQERGAVQARVLGSTGVCGGGGER